MLITGPSTGIGQAIAIRVAQEDANVAINYRSSPEQAEATEVSVKEACTTIRNNGFKDMIIQADISKEDQVKEMFARAIEAFGSIDVLVNNAGIQSRLRATKSMLPISIACSASTCEARSCVRAKPSGIFSRAAAAA